MTRKAFRLFLFEGAKQMRENFQNPVFNYEIVEQIAVLSDQNGVSKELNMVSWGNGKPKYDLRPWKKMDDGRKLPLKGVRIYDYEMDILREALTNMKKAKTA